MALDLLQKLSASNVLIAISTIRVVFAKCIRSRVTVSREGETEMRLAVVGAGYWGVNLIRVFSQLGVLHCVCDFSPDRLARLRTRYPDVKTETCYDAILTDPAVDAVVIATPAECHYDMALRALLAGKDTYVEKPLTLRCEDAQKLAVLAEREGLILMVGHLLEFHPAITRLQDLIEQGELGRLEYIYSNRLNMGKVRREENALWSFAPHDISVILLLMKQLPIQVAATGGTYLQPNIADVTVSTMLFDRGVRAHLFVSWLHPYKEQKLVVVGERRMAVFDDVRKTEKLQIYDKKIDLVNGQFVTEKPAARTIDFSLDEPLLLECRHFLECIETRQSSKTDGHDGWRVLRVLEASQRSLSMNGEPVQLEPLRSLEVVRG
jgi:UDP-2-acetamido-3-amino-2,3-dideoxy-glucuronate N-acetyltransferase